MVEGQERSREIVLTLFAALGHGVGEVGEADVDRRPLGQVRESLGLRRGDGHLHRRLPPGFGQRGFAIREGHLRGALQQLDARVRHGGAERSVLSGASRSTARSAACFA